MMKKPILLDGAAGTTLWELAEKAGVPRKPVWLYNMEHPELVVEMHKRFVEAGSQLILANTFEANGPAVQRSSGYQAPEVIRTAIGLARQAAGGRDVKVALDLGPLTMLLEPYGDLEEDECTAIYDELMAAGAEAGADCVVLETFMDVSMMALAAAAGKRHGLPVFCSMTFEKGGRTMMGNTVQQIVDTLTPVGVDAVGMNCSLGPAEALSVIREFHEKTDLPLFYKPNAGKPELNADGSFVKPYTAEQFAAEIAPALELVSYVGGCCGCDAGYVRALKALLDA